MFAVKPSDRSGSLRTERNGGGGGKIPARASTYRNDAVEFGSILDGKVARRKNVDAVVLDTALVRQANGIGRLVPFAHPAMRIEQTNKQISNVLIQFPYEQPKTIDYCDVPTVRRPPEQSPRLLA